MKHEHSCKIKILYVFQQQEELQAEVENTVHAFELSGKIPSSLMEAR